MAKTFTRKELYELVWAEPMRNIAARMKISDVGLAKACRKANVPVPPRGYWNKSHAGHKVIRLPLLPRGPGQSDTVTIGRPKWHWPPAPFDESEPEPLPPVFDEPIEAVRHRVEKAIGKVPIYRHFETAHPLVKAALDRDEQLRASGSSWRVPVFDDPVERRRLQIINALLLSLVRHGYAGGIRGEKADDIGVQIGSSHISLALERIRHNSRSKNGSAQRPRLRLLLKQDRGEEPIGEDGPGTPIEHRLRSILVELVVLGEARYRERLVHSHEWQLESRAGKIAEAQRLRDEAAKKERERILALEQARVDRLLSEAASLCKATEIRAYVDAVRRACAHKSDGVSNDSLEKWERWALQQADRIDPIISKAFLLNPELTACKYPLDDRGDGPVTFDEPEMR